MKTKRLLRKKVWFPGIDGLVERRIRQYIPYQATNPEPLKMSGLPPAPWCDVSVYFAGPLPSGDMLLVTTDDYSCFPEVEIIKSTSATNVITNLDNVFSRYGIPQTVRTDNGPPFQGEDFRNFVNDLGFTHRRITHLWPQANDEVERFMDIILKAIRTAHIKQKNWNQEMYRFLRQYRTTPHCTAGVAPAKALYNTTLHYRRRSC